MAIALFLAALLVAAFDFVPLPARASANPDLSFDLLRCAPLWLVALPLVCGAWGALGDWLRAALAGGRARALAHLAFDGALALPLIANVVPLFSGPAIRQSPFRWPAALAACAIAWLAVSLCRRAAERLARRPPRPWWGAAMAALALSVLLVGSFVTVHVLHGLYASFHRAITLVAVLALAFSVRVLMREAPPPGLKRTARWLALAGVSALAGGALASSASGARLTLIEHAALLGPWVAPVHHVDTLLRNTVARPPASRTERLARFDALAPSGDRRASVLLVTIDALRHDALDPGSAIGRCMPQLNALAHRARRYERAYAPSNCTIHSLTTMFTGRITTAGNELWTRSELIADAFTRAGYSTSAWFTAHQMPTVRERLDAIRRRGFEFQGYRSDYRDAREVMAWAEERLRASKPAFVWVHLSDVHAPFQLAVPPGAPRITGCEDDYLARHAFVDREVAQALARAGASDAQLLWAITADHGESLGERGFTGHSSNLFDEQVRVPLLIGGAGLSAATVDDVVALVDLGPSLLAAASAPADAALGHVWRASRPGSAFINSDTQCAFVRWPYKLISTPSAGTLALYDLARDRGELDNLAARLPEQVAALRRQIDRLGCAAP